MSMNECPTELLELFVEQVSDDQSALRSLRGVNKTFYVLSTPEAFRTAYVTNRAESTVGLRSLMECGELAKYVNKIVFRWTDGDGDSDGAAFPQGGPSVIQISLINVFARLHRFSSLATLELSFFPRSSQSVAECENASFVESVILQSLVLNRTLPRIRTLVLNNLVPFPAAFYEHTGFARLLANVEDLRITVHGIGNIHAPGQDAQELWAWMWQEIVPIRFLIPPRRQLTSLVLTSDQPVGRAPLVDLSGLFYPALRHLELGGMTFSSARRMEDFIVRHGRTLTSLVLDSCPMHVELDPPQPPTRTWTDVCDRFNEELHALVDLQIHLRTRWGLDDMSRTGQTRLTYEPSMTGFGYARGTYRVDLEDADRPAMDRLFATVHARKRRMLEGTWDVPPLPEAALQEEPSLAPFVVTIH